MENDAKGYFLAVSSSLISVVIPCYNSETLIGKAIQSIQNQTYTNWELIVVDDASQDNSVHKIEAIQDSRIKLIKLTVNQGYPAAMNAGIAQAKGEYIARMDADDISAPGRLEEQINLLHANPRASFCGTNRFRITPGGKMYIDRVKNDHPVKWESWDDLMSGVRIFTDASVVIRRETILQAGGYRTYQRSGMDVDLWLRVMEKFGPEITSMKPLYGRTIEPNSLIFNPATYSINQIPRVLATQRKERGQDDVQDGKSVVVEDYIRKGWVKEGKTEDKVGLFFGSLVTCLWLRDWKGVGIYYRQIRHTSNLSLARITFIILKKLTQRMRNNPFERNNLF